MLSALPDAPRSQPVSGPFGGPRFRSRFTDAVWQGPTWSFAILLLVLRLFNDPADLHRGLLLTGFAVVMATTLGAIFVRWERLPAWTQPALPATDLVGAGLMVVSDPLGASTTILLCSLPVVWLAFEFGRRGVIAGIAVTAVTGLTSFLTRPVEPRAIGSASVLVSAVFVIGLAIVARVMSGVLRRIGEDLSARTDEVEAERVLAEERLAIMTGVMESIDVAVIVLQSGVDPVLNEQAHAMASRMGLASVSLAEGSTQVFSDDGGTPVRVPEQAITRAVAGEEFAGVMHWIGEPGDQRVVIASARQFPRPDGDRWVTVLAAWDGTELVDAIKVRENFLTTVSHELRTPLTAIIASVELLPDLLASEPGSDSARLLTAIDRNTGLLKARIDDLMSSAASVDTSFRPVRTDATALVREALAKHDPQVEAADLTLGLVADQQLLVELDPARFEQVVDNLVSNALKYTAAGGRVVVSLHVVDHHLVLAVADTGTGMTFDEQRQVFDRFYRAPRVKAGAVAGLGIGLSLVKSIVERHHGTIDLRSTLGVGTTVTVTVPVALTGAASR